MSLLRPCNGKLARGIALSAALAAAVAGLTASRSGLAIGAGTPALHAAQQCYLVGSAVQLRGTGFGASRTFVVTIDGVYFGQDTTDETGAFRTSLRPGGLNTGVPQAVEDLQASDGSATAGTTFTLTRAAGARFLAARAGSQRLPIEVWGFALNGARRAVYVHYVSPSGRVARTVHLGHTGGQCGYLRTGPRPIFPFSASPGKWTLQLDTSKSYARHPAGPRARIRVRVG